MYRKLPRSQPNQSVTGQERWTTARLGLSIPAGQPHISPSRTKHLGGGVRTRPATSSVLALERACTGCVGDDRDRDAEVSEAVQEVLVETGRERVLVDGEHDLVDRLGVEDVLDGVHRVVLDGHGT